MNRIVKILMERDDITEDEAKDLLKETKQMMEDCGYDPEESERIFMENLGLEMDYIMDFLYEK